MSSSSNRTERLRVRVGAALVDPPLAVFVSLGLANRAIPYTVTGTVTVGGERLNVDVPYTINGTITREQLIGTGLRSLPKIPGLTISP